MSTMTMPSLIKLFSRFLPRGVNPPIHSNRLSSRELGNLTEMSIPVSLDGRISLVKGMIDLQHYIMAAFLDTKFSQYVIVDGPDPQTGVWWARCDNQYTSCILYNKFIPDKYQRLYVFSVVVR